MLVFDAMKRIRDRLWTWIFLGMISVKEEGEIKVTRYEKEMILNVRASRQRKRRQAMIKVAHQAWGAS